MTLTFFSVIKLKILNLFNAYVFCGWPWVTSDSSLGWFIPHYILLMWYFSWCSSWEDDIIGFPDCDDFICERFARCKFDITLEHDIMVLSLRKRIILLEITLALISKNFNVLFGIFFLLQSHTEMSWVWLSHQTQFDQNIHRFVRKVAAFD